MIMIMITMMMITMMMIMMMMVTIIKSLPPSEYVDELEGRFCELPSNSDYHDVDVDNDTFITCKMSHF